ncbi:MAG: cyanoexosortase C [Kovacikia sp.]
MNWNRVNQLSNRLLHESLQTTHSRFVACGLLAGFCYVPFWFADLLVGTLHGAASLLMAAAVFLGLQRLWKQRQQLATLQVSEEDRLLGHLLILSGVLLCPFGLLAGEWAQRLIWMVILGGIACSSWGVSFFKKYSLPTFLIVLGLFPNPTSVGKALWESFTPPYMLEQLMAWAGSLGLRAIGQPAVLENAVIKLPGGAVEVNWGCSGFDMATVMAAAGLVIGIFFKQRFSKILLLMATGVALAFLFNIPRIMLMAVAEAYWGKASFQFWHGSWGGQIFSTLLFTVYYYAFMGFLKRGSTSKPTEHTGT